MTVVFVLLSLLITCGARADHIAHARNMVDADRAAARLTVIACDLADHFNAGRMHGDLYAHLDRCRREAHRAVVRWQHGRDEHVARACMEILERAVAGVTR